MSTCSMSPTADVDGSGGGEPSGNDAEAGRRRGHGARRRIERLHAGDVIRIERAIPGPAGRNGWIHRGGRHGGVIKAEGVAELVRGDVLDVETVGTSRRSRKKLKAAVPEHDVGVDDAGAGRPPVRRGDRGAARRV